MKRFLIVFLLMCSTVYAAMSDSSALTKARGIWGAKATTGTQRTVGAVYVTRQVGYMDDSANFVVVGSGVNTWEAAFASIPADYTPPVPHVLTAVARDVAGNTTESAPVKVFVCNFPCVAGKVTRIAYQMPTPGSTVGVTITPFIQEVVFGMPIEFAITRTGSTASDLTVNYFVGNSAEPNLDYMPALSSTYPGLGSTVIPAGSQTKIIHLSTLINPKPWMYPLFVTIQLQLGAYILGPNNAANAGIWTSEQRPELPGPPPAPNQQPIGSRYILNIPSRRP